MKYLLILQSDAEVLPLTGHDRFRRAAAEAGELIAGQTLADPSTGLVVGTAEPTGIRGYYLVDVETTDRAVELAHLLRESQADGFAVEIRAVMFTAGADY
jgi:hypothetical protein